MLRKRMGKDGGKEKGREETNRTAETAAARALHRKKAECEFSIET
jgi:hypothetical protein